jgi:hypothetical protein
VSSPGRKPAAFPKNGAYTSGISTLVGYAPDVFVTELFGLPTLH